MSTTSLNINPNTNGLIENGLNLGTADASTNYILNFNYPSKLIEFQFQWNNVSSSTGAIHIYDTNDPNLNYYEYIVTDTSLNLPLSIHDVSSGNVKVLLNQFMGVSIKLTVSKGNSSAGTLKIAYGSRSI